MISLPCPSIAHGRSWMPCAPAGETIGSGSQERKPFDQGATHTHTFGIKVGTFRSSDAYKRRISIS